MKVYVIGTGEESRKFISEATDANISKILIGQDEIILQPLTSFQLMRSSVKDADYVIFLNDKDFEKCGNRIEEVPYTLYFGDENPKEFIEAQIKFELANPNLRKPTNTETTKTNESVFYTSLSTLFTSRKSPSRNDEKPGMEMSELNRSFTQTN